MPEREHLTRIIGRSREIEAAGSALRELQTGQGGVLMYSGEPGIGKSTLVRKIARDATEAALPVYWGFCWEAGGAPAYWPWTQLLQSINKANDAVACCGLFPILSGDDDTDDSATLDPDQARFRLLESVRSYLVSVSESAPIVLVLEDLHAADAESLRLLQHIARHIAAMPILIVGTFRELEAKRKPAMDALWRAARDGSRVRVSRFDAGDIREFLESGGAAETSKEEVNRLLDTTAGNPLFLTELLGFMERRSSRDSALPESLQQVILQHLSLLPESTLRQLSIAAVVGREFAASAVAALQPGDEALVGEAMAVATEAGVVEPVDPGRYRFSHVLHRDVLYQRLRADDREDLHFRNARQLEEAIVAGDVRHLSAYATHIQAAGPDHSSDAVDAWQNAAVQAGKRLAFDDAAACFGRALAAFGEGPKSDPAERCRLMLRHAEALLLAGNIEAGHRTCSDAFRIAEAMQDEILMTDAALTWGSTIVVASVDADLIGALEASLDALPTFDLARRAKVQARLAAARQPARNPEQPMAMARQAITMARSTGDDELIYAVLRSATSALMDFAPAGERIRLNAEFIELARQFGDTAGQFRGHLRMVIDASEVADRDLFDRSIESCRQIADQIDLPHYQWRVASIRAMRATIEGRFERALELIDTAEVLAEAIDHVEAKITLPLQRFTLLCEWDSPRTTPLQSILAELETAYRNGLSQAEFFVAPLVTSLTIGEDDGRINQFLGNPGMIDRTFAGGDRFSLTVLGELASRAGQEDLARRAYDRLEKVSEECATTGLMGSSWCGPVARTIGEILLRESSLDESAVFLSSALAIAEKMRARPQVARCHALLAEVEQRRGNTDDATLHRGAFDRLRQLLDLRKRLGAPAGESAADVAEPETSATLSKSDDTFHIELDGEIWHVRFRNESVSLRDTRGLQLLAKLVATPDTDVHVLDLVGADRTADSGDAGPLLDAQAKADYRSRIEELNAELDEATGMADIDRADSIRTELDFLTQELSRAYGLGGRARSGGRAAERARVNVRRRLKDAIERISESAPATGKFLDNSIKTGTYCRYSPA